MASSHAPVRWVASDIDGLPLKRKQVAQACATCRKRKKRCVHVKESLHGSSPVSGYRSLAGQSERTGQQALAALPESPSSSEYHATEEEDATQVAANHLVELSSSRFVGDLNPEGFIIQVATPALPTTRPSYRDSNDLGVWLPPAELTDSKPVDDTKTTATSPHTPGRNQHGMHHSSLSAVALVYQRAKRNYIKECLSVVPPPSDYAVLHRIYCEKVHPLFPVLNDSDLAIDEIPAPATGTTTSSSMAVFRAVVKQIIALAAAQVDMEAAESHLRLEEGGPLLSPRTFQKRLADAAATVLEADMMINRFDSVRVLTLMAFFYQPSSDVDRNRPSLFCNHAVHHFHTLGAHLQGYRPPRPEDDVDRIFCTLWALDRFCSVFYARPCLMHAQDLGKSIEDCVAKQPPCLRLFMVVVMWLDRVIQLYRPRQPFVLIDIPVFESLILDAEAERLPSMHIATIEVLYHTVCVLSCRQPTSAFSDIAHARDRAYLPLSIINPRRSHSTDRIVWVTQTQPLCCFPFIPYAVSLALSVQYKKLRYSRTPMFRARARACFKDVVQLLKSMNGAFLSARVNAALGESILTQMEKTASTLVREELENSQTASALDTSTALDSNPPSTCVSAPAIPSTTSDGFGTVQHNKLVENSDAVMGTTVTTSMQSVPTTDSQDYRATVVPTHPTPAAALFDLSIPDSLATDVDLFSNFDPSFDLGAVDTALEANLDMGIPQNWASWNHVT